MDNIEMIEKLVEKADVTYEEAKGVLESLNWNLLDALIALEKEGKLKKEEKSSFTTKQEAPEYYDDFSSDTKETTFGDIVKKAVSWTGGILKKGMENRLCIIDEEGEKFSVPLTILGVFTIVAFWAVIVVFAFEFFTGSEVRIEGPDFGTEKVNSVMSSIKFNHRKSNKKDINIDDKK